MLNQMPFLMAQIIRPVHTYTQQEPWFRLHGDLPYPKLRTLPSYFVGSWVCLLCTNRRSNDRWQHVSLNHLHGLLSFYDQWLILRRLVALLFDFGGVSHTWRKIDSQGDCYLRIKTSQITRYKNVLIVQLDGCPLAICRVRHPSGSLPIFYLRIWSPICFWFIKSLKPQFVVGAKQINPPNRTILGSRVCSWHTIYMTSSVFLWERRTSWLSRMKLRSGDLESPQVCKHGYHVWTSSKAWVVQYRLNLWETTNGFLESSRSKDMTETGIMHSQVKIVPSTNTDVS